MAGEYKEDVRPALPGAYTRYVARRPVLTPPAAAVTVAVPITHDWGPMDEPTLVGSWSEFQEDFGTTTTTPGARAVYDAFRGEGLEGLGGAGGVLVQRIGGSSALKATVSLNNAGGTPAPALRADARYEGTRGNGLSLLVSPIISGTQEVSVMRGTQELESFVYTIATAGAMAALAAAINAVSPWVRLTLLLEGTTGLTAGTFPLIGGNDGSTLASGDYTAAFGVFSNEDFAFMAPQDIPWAQGATEPAPTNRGLIASLVAWAQAECNRGHRFITVVGGALDELVADALARAQSINNPNVVTVGGPGVNDDDWGPRSTAQLAPRVAGILAQRGEGAAAHLARLAGTTPRNKAAGGALTLADAEALAAGGVIPLMRDRYKVAPTVIAKSINTYLGDSEDVPNDVWSNPKYVLSMQQLANDAEADIERNLISRGGLVNDSLRNAAAARVLRIARQREGTGFSPGVLVTPLPGAPTDEFVELDVRLAFGRALAQLFIRGNVQ